MKNAQIDQSQAKAAGYTLSQVAAGAMTLIEATQYPGDGEWPSSPLPIPLPAVPAMERAVASPVAPLPTPITAANTQYTQYTQTPQTPRTPLPRNTSATARAASIKKRRARRTEWTDAATETLLREATLLRAAGANAGSGLNSNGWKALIKTLQEQHRMTVDRGQIKNRLNSLIKPVRQYNLFLKALSGWGRTNGYDPPMNSEEVMDLFFDAHPEFLKFRDGKPPFYDLVNQYITGCMATGDYAKGVNECIKEAVEVAKNVRNEALVTKNRQSGKEKPKQKTNRSNDRDSLIDTMKEAARIMAEAAPQSAPDVKRHAFRICATDLDDISPDHWKENGVTKDSYHDRVLQLIRDDETFAALFADPSFSRERRRRILTNEYEKRWGKETVVDIDDVVSASEFDIDEDEAEISDITADDEE
ncbi:hypothetical protein KEM55_004579 [Ascosphaera atra]|nr:hypothetical protein KEM55_004579 [Ascosphaera atra]